MKVKMGLGQHDPVIVYLMFPLRAQKGYHYDFATYFDGVGSLRVMIFQPDSFVEFHDEWYQIYESTLEWRNESFLPNEGWVYWVVAEVVDKGGLAQAIINIQWGPALELE